MLKDCHDCKYLYTDIDDHPCKDCWSTKGKSAYWKFKKADEVNHEDTNK